MLPEFQSLIFTYGEAGAREKFEEICFNILYARYRDVKRITPNPGDDGIDMMRGDINCGVEVYQCKFFINGIGESQKNQIRESYQKATTEHTVTKWFLMLPCNMTIKEREWWDGWRRGKEIETIEGSALIAELRATRLYDDVFGTVKNRAFEHYIIENGVADFLDTSISSEMEYYSMNSRMDVVLRIVCANQYIHTEEYDKLIEEISDTIVNSNGPVFLMANGGMGKSTMLGAIAYNLSKNRTVLCVDFGVFVDHRYLISLIDDIIHESDENPVLCIDNPTRNPEELLLLYNLLTSQPKRYRKLRILFVDRIERFISELKGSGDYRIWQSTGKAYVLWNGEKDFISQSLSSYFIQDDQIFIRSLSEEIHKKIIEKVVGVVADYYQLNGQLVSAAQEMLCYNNRSIADIFLDFRREYNTLAEQSSTKATSIEWDWDAWARKTRDILSDKVRVQDTFKYVAALDIVGVNVTLELLQHLCGIHDPLILKEIFPVGLIEPVRIEGNRIVLRHDTIADNFFSEHQDITLMDCLMFLVKNNCMDKTTVLSFERIALSTKHIFFPETSPADVKALIYEFDRNEEYKTIIQENGRMSSLELAKVSIHAIKRASYKSEEFKIVCGEQIQMVFRDVFDQEVSKYNQCGCWGRFFLFAVRNCSYLPDSMLTIFSAEDKEMVCLVTKQVISLIKKNKIDSYSKYNEMSVKVFERIHDLFPDDQLIKSYLIEMYLQADDYKRAQYICSEIINSSGANYKNLLSVLKVYNKYAKKLFNEAESQKKIDEVNEAQLEIFRKLEQSVPLDSEEYIYLICRQARFTYNVRKDYDTAMDILYNIPEDSPWNYRRHIEIGILHCQKKIQNNLYNINNAEECFLKAVELMKIGNVKDYKSWLSVLRPLAQVYYWRWQHVKCVDTCKRALKYNPNEKKVIELMEMAKKAIMDVASGKKKIPKIYAGLDGQPVIGMEIELNAT